MDVSRHICALLLMGGLVFGASNGFAKGTPEEGEPGVRETLEVKQADHKDRKHESLRFLRDNRAFLRAQFDELRLDVGYERDGDADMIDERMLLLARLSSEIAAARDTLQVEHARSLGRDLLMSVAELAELEAQLELFDQLLVDQQGRLLELEGDFLGRQRTALVVVVRGLPESGAPTALLLQEENTTLRVELSGAQARALEQGGVAQIYHEFVEPRAHRLELRLVGAGWDEAKSTWIDLETPRDQLTFLELDLASLDPDQPESRPGTQIWRR